MLGSFAGSDRMRPALLSTRSIGLGAARLGLLADYCGHVVDIEQKTVSFRLTGLLVWWRIRSFAHLGRSFLPKRGCVLALGERADATGPRLTVWQLLFSVHA